METIMQIRVLAEIINLECRDVAAILNPRLFQYREY